MTQARAPRLARWLWRGYLARHWRPLALALLFMAIEGASLGVFASMMEPMFDRVFVEGARDALWTVGAVVMGVFLLRAVTSMGQRILLARVAEVSSADLRADMLRHLMRLDGAFHQANPPGALIERVQGDVAALGKVWSNILTGLGRDAVSVVALFTVALTVDWRWTLVALIGVPLLISPALMVQRFVRARARQSREIAGRMSTRLDEVFHGMAAVKLNRLERHQADRFDRLAQDRIAAETRAAAGQAGIPALIDVMTGLGFLGVLIYGGTQIIEGEKTLGEFMAFFTAISLAFEPLRRLGNLTGLWQAAAASIERIKAILDTEPTLKSPANPVAAPEGAPEIRIEGVHLSYGDTEVLRGLDLVAPAGQTTAIVGPSGAGKSTVFHLLTRLVDPQSGRITLDGVPVTAMALDDLRELFSVVSQDTALFDETLRDNIVLNRAGVSQEELDEVLTGAHVADFLSAMPQGLDSPAGPRGSALSGGQRQRIAIARALLRNAPVLLLDEATSALDSHAEAVVQGALDRLSRGRTTLVIAHRLSTVRAADRIVVMEAGRVVEQGTHDDLMARGGTYATLHAMQFRDGTLNEEGRPKEGS
ncbi:ABC transporter ATP-binding protein [Ponticoccus sp. SC2-23]|uniref:ABC transporter ATP-binding protein n=1 Tax=Alexandriicola marinus TaxID=2081710 RepID=UPI000FD7A8CC|nr:ABC transporter ATP-binding protein [Alexandriicola marinus]MBM1221631.1 ABC transporter ATP-binding protein [Ponticoccus sp. SC6-9]MBM1226672.1 ABC transporter ATP-binding protein [Ponticoccus sp. SC6-15]MBM1230623.1 ABC transporter ATP-binding protein [Ponticoccus sp. SC6-38]MBM1235146.1 ABC transporter ATP-binding protein [Ponticoccus sp. SC6-45]MBM1239644.1 ABC transporter ATP-binding protein [Ponticoccus sp. SC6-49]MBM1243426.1 ABC transporter ATP-binding protein [Ponticoccus sp. SC2-